MFIPGRSKTPMSTLKYKRNRYKQCVNHTIFYTLNYSLLNIFKTRFCEWVYFTFLRVVYAYFPCMRDTMSRFLCHEICHILKIIIYWFIHCLCTDFKVIRKEVYLRFAERMGSVGNLSTSLNIICHSRCSRLTDIVYNSCGWHK